MKDSGPSLITDKASLLALVTGVVVGLSAALLRVFIVTIPGIIAGTQLQLVLILTLAVISALVTVFLARKQFTSRLHTPGEAGRLGIQAGVFCALWAGAVLTALATWDASGADSAALDRRNTTRLHQSHPSGAKGLPDCPVAERRDARLWRCGWIAACDSHF